MRLVLKLTLVIGCGLIAVLLVASYFRVQREVALFENDMRHDHRLLGRALARAVAEVWHLKGRQVALDMLAHANGSRARVRVRWVRPGAPAGSALAPHGSAAELAPLGQGRPTDLFVAEGDGVFYTYVPIRGAQPELGALEISEPLTHQRRYVRTTVTHTAATTGVVALVSVLLAFLAGTWIVGRPVRALAMKARRVGDGDLSGPLDLRRSDEFGALAEELNAMCKRLGKARTRVEAETAARIAALEQLRHADRLSTVGKLSAGIAHELGTPLNVVQGRADMIHTAEVTGAEALDSARIIKEQAQRMARIVKQLMQFARQRKAELCQTELVEVARETTSLLQPMADKRQVGLELLSSREPVLAEADSGQLQQALTNLVINAVHAAPPGTAVEVRVGRSRVQPPVGLEQPEADYAFISVTDHGTGMAPDVAGRVFEPFFTTKGVGEGAGLGLAVSFGIAREHGGWITVDTEVGRGSTFTIYIPGENSQL